MRGEERLGSWGSEKYNLEVFSALKILSKTRTQDVIHIKLILRLPGQQKNKNFP